MEVERGQSHVLVRVRDTGRGIAADALPHVFEYFRQGSTSAGDGAGGLGLGLYIVRNVVELHGGSVSAESEGKGKGASFTFSLPLRRLETSPPESEPRVASDPSIPISGPLDGVSVLVIDDDPDARELVATILVEKGADVSLAHDAATALALFDARRPDVVVSELRLAAEEENALIRAVRARTERVPALAVSAFAAPRDRDRAFNAGFEGYLSTPLDPQKLLDTIQAMAHPLRK